MALANFLIRLAYGLQASARYRAIKRWGYDLLENPRAWQRPYFDSFMIVLVMTSVFMLLYEVQRDLGDLGDYFELAVVTIFIVEYLARMWLYSDSHKILIEHYERAELVGARLKLAPALWAMARRKLAYMGTPLAIIDLLAILPSYRPLRFLRLFLIFRLLKLFRYTRNLSAFGSVLAEKRFELTTLSLFFGFIVFTAAVAIYLFEASDPASHVKNLFDAVYWAVITVATVGYGDITPVSTEGRVVTIVLVVTGLGVLSFATSIIVTAFTGKMEQLRADRVFAEVERLDNVTIVCGFGRIGQVVAERLARTREPFVVVDRDASAVALAQQRGFLAVHGDATDSRLLQHLGLGNHATKVLCLTHDDVSNVYITLSARQLARDLLIVSRANKAETVHKLSHAGATQVVRPYEMVARMAAEYIGQPVAFDAVYGVVTGTQGIRLEPVALPPGSPLAGAPLRHVDFARRNLLLFGVIRAREAPVSRGHDYYELATQHFYFNPPPDFRLHAHDLLVVIGHEFSVYHLKESLEAGDLRRGPV